MIIEKGVLLPCICMVSLMSVCRCQFFYLGPLNISRVEGEQMVLIPCPFIGQYGITWEINGVLYEPFDLPLPYLATSSGLLIIQVELNMNGHSFRCYYPSGNGPLAIGSSIGFLHVEDRENFDLVEIVLQPKLLHLDHQRLYFGISNKTFAWKHIQPASNDNISYKMESKEGCCRENTIVNTWNDIDDSEITLPNNALANNGELVYFNISDTQADLKLDRRFQINASVITEELQVSMSNGTDVYLEMEDFITLRLAVGLNPEDCLCPLLFTMPDIRCFDFTRCCINNTKFIHSFSFCEINVAVDSDNANETRTQYKFGVKNLSLELDYSRFHFYQAKKCSDCNPPLKPSYSTYIKSYEIHIVIPEKPKVRIEENGEVCIMSQDGIRNLPMLYEISVSDITGEVVMQNETTPTNITDCVSFDNLFHQNSTLCAPFTVTVKAKNNFGSATTSLQVNLTDEVGEVCSCLNTRVNGKVSEVASSKTSITVAVEIFCSQLNIMSNHTFMITVGSMHKNIIITCNVPLSSNNKTENVTFSNVDTCKEVYNISVFWISPEVSLAMECPIAFNETEIFNKCAGNHTTIIIAATGACLSFLIILCICIIVQILICVRIKRGKQIYTLVLRPRLLRKK